MQAARGEQEQGARGRHFRTRLRSGHDYLDLSVGFWRHSNQTLEMWRCKHSGDWSPCSGGAHAGHDGDGYCDDGYHGPRCELCDHSEYFDEDDARCHGCGDVTAQTSVLLCAVVLLSIAVVGLMSIVAGRNFNVTKRCRAVPKAIRGALNLYRKSGMRYKIKTLVGFFQCVAAIPSVYNVTAPPGLDEYAVWSNFLELPSDLGASTIIPGSCIGSYNRSRPKGTTTCIPLLSSLYYFA